MNDAAASADAAARERALDTARSFIVRAPAGSGKTGLLIQRYLALLARVDEPEAIVAMTFTRKARAEILERVIEALSTAAGAEPGDAHQRTTWRLASAVMRRDAERGWSLRAHPARLRIHTIDAVGASLMGRAPLATGVGAQPRLVDDASGLYVRAARSALRVAGADDGAWRTLLLHMDNDAQRVVEVLVNLLARRDQWQAHLTMPDRGLLRQALRQAVRAESEQVLARVRAQFPEIAIAELIRLAGIAGVRLTSAASPHALSLIAERGVLPPADAQALPEWRAMADWLLVKAGKFRIQLGTETGFATEDAHGNKAAMAALLDCLRGVRGLAPLLALARQLPEAESPHADWALLDALIEVIPRLLAQLRVAFAREGVIDFVEATRIALEALGHDDAPGDLLLSADARIEHWLIDEFQDTSRTQCRLVERLTSGWSDGDGRTVFLVGDPMQSIYGFREADVERFIEAWQERRLGVVALEPLTLQRNFRSGPRLVAWVNDAFGALAAARDDAIERIEFAQAVAAGKASATDQVTVDLFRDPGAEADALVQRVREALDAGAGSVAILVRKRRDLDAAILPALRNAGIAFAGVALETLGQRPAVLDLLSLTHALLQPADRLAWAAVLRAPWCGLDLRDLHTLTTTLAEPASLLESWLEPPPSAALSPDGQARLARLRAAIAPALDQRGRWAPVACVRSAWLALGGPATLAEPVDRIAADGFFAALEAHARGGDIADWHALIHALDSAPLEPEPSSSPAVQVMTLHRAKGLEFDVVLMPALGLGAKTDDTPLVRWRERANGLLLAPRPEKAPDANGSVLYAYLSTMAKHDAAAELDRLLYVGCTRARRRLHLSGTAAVVHRDHQIAWGRPKSGTALAALWPAIAAHVAPPGPPAPSRPGSEVAGVPLRRLTGSWRLPAAPQSIPGSAATDIEIGDEGVVFDWARERARQLGIAAHALLQRIAIEGVQHWNTARIAAQHPQLVRTFASAGFDAAEADAAAADLVAALTATLADARGCWLLDSAHADASSERAITAVIDDALVHVVLDRTFIDAQGVRWIVDFKLSGHEGGDLDAFLDRERERYRGQLERYARAMQALDPRPVRLGLYFPRLSGWREWAPGG